MDLSARAIAETLAIVAAIAAIGAGIADRRQRKRKDLDRIGLIDWRSIQVFALISAIVTAGLAFNL